MKHGTIIKVAEGNFPFHFWIQKAVARDDMGKMVVEGVASTINVDHDKERMSAEALKSMANIINTSGVPLRVEHSQNENAIIGIVNKAWIDDRNQLWIKAVLDEQHPAAGILYKGLKEGVKMGLSVGGFVRRATQEMVEGVGKMVNTFYDVLLDEVSITQKPSNYDARLMAKSFAKSEGAIAALAEVYESSEFLFHSAMGQSDYLQAFAKSVDGEWEDYKLTDKSNSMSDETEKKTKAKEDETETKTTKAEETETKTTKGGEETEEKTTKMSATDEEKTEKSVSRAEFNELVKMVAQGFNGLTKAFGKMSKALENEAVDQREPEQKKEDPEAGKTVNKISGGEAKDGEQPDENKKDPEAGKKVGKNGDDGDDETGERERETKARKGPKEDAHDNTYDLETVERAIKRIKAVGAAMDTDEKTTKAEETEEKTTKAEETETRKSRKIASVDEFVLTVADTIERMEKSMKDKGMQSEHVAKMMINNLRSDPEFRKDLAHFMAEPGAKRSVISGTPFVKMKDGRMFQLTLSENGERTEKSAADAPKDFKRMWGTKYSSQKTAD